MHRIFRTSLFTLVCCFVLPAAAAPTPAPSPTKKSPPPKAAPPKIKPPPPKAPPPGPAPALPPPAELALTRVARADSTTLTPGSNAQLLATVENRSATAASIMVGIPSNAAGSPVLRSAAAVVPAHSQATLRIAVPIEVERIANERFVTRAYVIDPRKPARGSLATQTWRDGHMADNSRSVTLPVRVDYYTVTVTLPQLRVNEDCTPGPAPSIWDVFLGAFAFDPTTHARSPGKHDRQPVRASSGQVSRTTHKVVLNNVRKDQTIEVKLEVGFRIAANSVGRRDFWVPAATWRQRATSSTYPALAAYFPSCGSHPYDATFTVSAVPVTLH